MTRAPVARQVLGVVGLRMESRSIRKGVSVTARGKARRVVVAAPDASVRLDISAVLGALDDVEVVGEAEDVGDLAAVPDVVETVKWRKPSNPGGVPVWELDGIICTGETYKDKVKTTFAQGAALDDPAGMFNASLNAGTRRAIDLHEGDEWDEDALKELVAAAAAYNANG